MEKIIEIQGVVSLQKTLKDLLSHTQFDSLVHSMAVSDYTIRGLVTEDDLIKKFLKIIPYIKNISNQKEMYSYIKEAFSSALYNAEGKISSDYESLLVFMDRAPKVISCVKQMQPNTILVGFKLLSNVDEETLVAAAKEQMQLSGSDFVLANDLADIDGDNHKGLLISSKGIIDRPATKQDIAKSIVNHVTNCIGRD